MTIKEREYQEMCLKILKLAVKDYMDSSRDRGMITQFVNSNICDLYCEMAGIDIDYFRELHEEAKRTTATNRR